MNSSGRTANKGMEGLAITPEGATLVGIMQNALIQDANRKGDAANLLRIVTIDIATGNVTHQYAYKLDDRQRREQDSRAQQASMIRNSPEPFAGSPHLRRTLSQTCLLNE